MKTNFFPFVLGCVLLLSLVSSPSLFADGPYHGKVIDKETKQPIEGAAVVAVWWKESRIIGYGHRESVHDLQETMTDKDGNFTIPGTSTFSLLFRIDDPLVTIFKPGYQAYPGAPFQPSTREVQTGLYEKDGRLVVEVKQLKTAEERLENQARASVLECNRSEKCPSLIGLVNAERATLGLGPIGPVKKGIRQ